MATAVQVNTTAAVPAVLAGTNPQWETIAATALQVSPADTRIEKVEAPG